MPGLARDPAGLSVAVRGGKSTGERLLAWERFGREAESDRVGDAMPVISTRCSDNGARPLTERDRDVVPGGVCVVQAKIRTSSGGIAASRLRHASTAKPPLVMTAMSYRSATRAVLSTGHRLAFSTTRILS